MRPTIRIDHPHTVVQIVHQEALVEWINYQWWADSWVHWPNERFDKAERLVLWARGVKPGPLDNWLFIPKFGHCGAVSELKRPDARGKRLPEKQGEWKERLEACGFLVDIHYGWEEAACFFAEYMGERGPK